MPELPEVETVRRDLEGLLVGRRIERAEITGARTVRRQPPEVVTSALVHRHIEQVRRLGKFLFIDMPGDVTLVVHLRMSGQLRWAADGSAPMERHTHARLVLDSGAELRFVDPRTFGEWWVTTHAVPELAHLGPDALDALPPVPALRQGLHGRRVALKTRLLDQRYLAGIGNIYADEICFEARVRPTRAAGTVSLAATTRLGDAVAVVLARAVELRGSTLSDEQYVDVHGRTGDAQSFHQVYGRAAQPCHRCGTAIRRVVIGGRSSFFCPSCQR